MPHVDLNSETIIGCEKGTKEWFHEEGHIVYNKSEKGIRNGYFHTLYLYLTLTFVVLAFVNKWIWFLAISSLLAMWFYFWYEEWWCWQYAFKQIREKENIK